jgi:hypothetical protein
MLESMNSALVHVIAREFLAAGARITSQILDDSQRSPGLLLSARIARQPAAEFLV